MGTFLLLLWAITVTATFAVSRLLKIVISRHGPGHWLVMLVALGGFVMAIAYLRATIGVVRGDIGDAIAWIAAAAYVALAIAAVRMLGPKRDAAPLLKRFPTAAPAALPPNRSDDKSEIEL